MPSSTKLALQKGLNIRSDYALIAVSVLLALFPVFQRDPYILNILIICMIFGVLAVSWNLICGFAGILTFGHQAFFGIGAYVSSLLAIKAGVSPWLGLIFGGLAAAASSFLIGLPSLRLRAAPYIAIMTLAFAEIVRICSMNLVDLTRGESGLWGIPHFPELSLPGIGSVSFSGGARVPYYYLIFTILIITMLVVYKIIHSYVGVAFRAIRDSQEAAESLGINLTYYKLTAFVISAFFAGVAGSFYAHYLLIITPSSVINIGIMIEIMAFTIVGGSGTFLGPLIGSFCMIIGLEYLRFLGEYRLITYGLLIVVATLFMPKGIAGRLFREKEIFD